MSEERTEPAVQGRATHASRPGNRFDRMEWAGAFGDLGTLIPFVVGYIGMVGMDPFGMLFAFGISLIVCGAYYRTPMPVQPMKAAGAVAVTQAAQTAVITPAAVVGASLATGLIWLLLGLTGTARRIAALVPRYVVIGIVLGLGMAFMIEGVKMMATGWIIATLGLVGTLLLLTNRSIPAMFVLLLFGAVCGIVADPAMLQKLAEASIVALADIRACRAHVERLRARLDLPCLASAAPYARQRDHGDGRREQSPFPGPPGGREQALDVHRRAQHVRGFSRRHSDVSRRRRHGWPRRLWRPYGRRDDYPGGVPPAARAFL
jgi:hypothetical protein